MSDLIINTFKAASDGSGFYRVVLPTGALMRRDVDVQLCPPDKIPRACHVAVIQRPLRPEILPLIDRFHEIGTAVVVDVDDDFHSISPNNAAWAMTRTEQADYRTVVAACNRADMVTVTTKALAERYGKHGRVAVLPNCVPQDFLNIKRQPHEGLRVGWTGTVRSHPLDLQVTGGGVAQAIEEVGARMVIIGDDGHKTQPLLRLKDQPELWGWKDLADYPFAIADFDVGIVPLESTKFNEAKSYLKGLEYAALGVPFVASPTAPYRQLADLGIGELAKSPRDWYRKTLRLLKDSDYRQQRGNDIREKARSLTIEANCGYWERAWEQAHANFNAKSLSPALRR